MTVPRQLFYRSSRQKIVRSLVTGVLENKLVVNWYFFYGKTFFNQIIFPRNYIADLVLTQEVIYKRPNSTLKLVCPIIKSYRSITWFGPLNLKIYAVGTDVSGDVSTQVDITETADEKSILHIHRFTEDTSGKFRCSDAYDERDFYLIIKRNPSDLVIVNATDDRIIAVQGREHNLECRVTSGQPGGNITWSTEGIVVAKTAPSLVSYIFTPNRSDNGKIFKCEAFNSEGESILESSVHLKVFYIPKITFMHNQTLTVKEGEEAQLICLHDGNDPNTTTVWQRQGTKTYISKKGILILKNVNRTDAGLYTCRIDTNTGVYEKDAKIVVQYAPEMDIRYFPKERKMVCNPSGVPDSYDFKDWEHTTGYNDHIRFLPITKEGNDAILTIPENVTGKDHLQDRGIYICRASNNISSSDGMIVMRKYNLSLNGIPYFVSSTENTQYGVYLKTAKIKIKFVSIPEYNSYDVYKNESRFTDFTESVLKNIKLTDNMYGKNVSVEGSSITLKIKIDTLDYFNSYDIVVKNEIGCSNHTIDLISASAPFTPRSVRTDAKQTQIYVLWTPGFDGGYPQWFIVEYKEMGEINWNNQTINSSSSTFIGGLQPATNYLIRIFARNMIDDSNRTEEILVQTDTRVSETNFSAIVSLFAVLLCLFIVASYFRRGKLKQFIYTRFTNQANSRAIGNDLDALQNGLHTNSDSAAEIPVYSSIDKRHNLRLHQTCAYTVDQKGITNPLKSVHQNRETGKEGKFGSMKCASGIEEGEKESRELNYVEIIFDKKPIYPFTIHGLDDKNNYVEIDFTQSADPLPDSDTDSEREK